MNRILFLARKEFIQIRRDWRTLALTLVLPVVVLLLFGYAITLDVKDVPLALVDHDSTEASRDLVREFSGSGYFIVTGADMEVAALMLERREAKAVMVIPAGFGRDMGRGVPSEIQLLLDGSDNNSSNIALGYAQGILQTYAFNATIRPAIAAGLVQPSSIPPIELVPRVRFNPELSSTVFIVPGLVAIIMMITVVVLSSLSIVKERELGTLETIMVSPLQRHEFILGKLTPYFVLAFADLFIILGAGKLFFAVPFRGSVITLTALSTIFILGGLGMGLFFSTVVETQRTAWMISLLSTLLPSIILSGFIFPIRIMPRWLQLVTYIVPVRYYLVILRGVVLKGAGVAELLPDTFALIIFAVLTITLSVARFRKRVA
ncbi:MAG TPA: ABC transporter permease [bacterium]|nr:ABC transporter permease [bacterium]